MMFTKDMLRALEADGEKLHQLTGENHGPYRFIFATCPACDGSGVETFGITVYEHGCGFSHPSTDERPCSECDGEGVVETEVEPINLEDLEQMA